MSQEALELFAKFAPGAKPLHMKSHGRLEIVGNHTDHNNGLCLVSGVNMGIDAYFAKRDDGNVVIKSKGYPVFRLNVTDLSRQESDKGTSLGLTRGVAFKLVELGYKVGGFTAILESDIFPGAGVSSSACYESLIVAIFSHLYNEDKVTPLEMAKVSQFAEAAYFGKPCGLLDQVGTSFGGIDYLDFASTEEPIVFPMSFSFPLQVILVNTGGSHAGLTPLYAEIPTDMRHIASTYFGKKSLREVNPDDFYNHDWSSLPLEESRAYNRAKHYFEENKRVEKAKEAILNNDMPSFLEAINASGESSSKLLKNTMVPGIYEGSPEAALDIARPMLKDGACRVMGGGFAGSIICFVPPHKVKEFVSKMKKVYGNKNVVPVEIVDGGPRLVD